MNKGKLYVVSTPIGNLDDISLRAIETLKSVAFVLAEDTRVSAKLLNRYEIDTQMVSYRDQNHIKQIAKVYEKLDIGFDLALISDAGTPTISDPGYKLVKELKDKGYEVISIPGADAATSALSVSGLATDRYIFLGFLVKSEKKRLEMLESYGNLDSTLIIYESPNRLLKLLEQIKSVLGNRRVCVAKDITKMYEDIYTSNIDDVIEYYRSKEKIVGEFVVLIEK
jgi:16S rRNA (cytidine1402-2'-O)-methyltransferase